MWFGLDAGFILYIALFFLIAKTTVGITIPWTPSNQLEKQILEWANWIAIVLIIAYIYIGNPLCRKIFVGDSRFNL